MNNAHSTPPATERFIEDFAVILEGDGLPRVAGRLFGLLIVTEEPLSLDELADALGVSKASISINARMLEERQPIQRVSRPGDRRDYYRPVDELFAHLLERRLAKWRRLHEIVGDARRTLPNKSTAVCTRLEQFDAASQQALDLIATTLEAWRSKQMKHAKHAKHA